MRITQNTLLLATLTLISVTACSQEGANNDAAGLGSARVAVVNGQPVAESVLRMYALTAERKNLEEMSPEDRERWGREMARVFPDVRPGDRIIGVNVPRQGARFFHNGEPIGSIDDAAFTRAFFGIWFDRGTSRPDLRRQLLGEP